MILKNVLIPIVWWITVALAKTQLKIGALFHETNRDAEMAFRYAIIRENMYNSRLEFLPLIRYVDPYDSFQAEKLACALASEGVVAIFGPGSQYTSNIVASVCNNLGIPHLIGHWQPEELVPAATLEHHAYTRNFFPESTLFASALADIIADNEWKSFTVIYEHADSLQRLQDVLQIHGPDDPPITVRQLASGSDHQPLLKEIYLSGETHILVDCSPEKLVDVLRQASGVKMMQEYQTYMITSIDAHMVNFPELNLSGGGPVRANISAIRLMNPHSIELETAVHDWRHGEFRLNGTTFPTVDKVSTDAALMTDAVRTFAATLREFNAHTNIEPMQMSCSSMGNRWAQGRSIIQALDQKTEEGLSGRIIFDDEGRRNDFYLEIIELSLTDELRKIAWWSPETGVSSTRTQLDKDTQITKTLQNKTIIVAARLGMPYLQMRTPAEGETLEGNDRYEGYAMDLIKHIANIRGFQYRFELVPETAYDSYNKVTKKWGGLIKQLLDHKADLAICDLTITFQRRRAVDFTMPFMTLGVSILYVKPKKEPPELFQFIHPLSVDVWMYMATAYLLVSIVLFFLAKLAADDWENPNPADPDPKELESIWNMMNCIWLTSGSIMQQGCDLMPKAKSTRFVVGLWSFFSLIVIQSYIANLAAFLTNERMEVTIENAEDLASQTEIKYGAVTGGSTLGFFKESNFTTYQRMWTAMEANPSVLAKSNAEGESRVTKGKGSYAFLMESASIEYIVERNCNLTQVGGLLDSKSYGIALPMNSPYRSYISETVLKLQEDGTLQHLKDTWWKVNDESKKCPPDQPSSDELDMPKVGGVFLVVYVGVAIGFFIGIMEFLWNTRQVAIRRKVSVWTALKSELLFIISVRKTTKPIEHSSNDSLGSSDENYSVASIPMDELDKDNHTADCQLNNNHDAEQNGQRNIGWCG